MTGNVSQAKVLSKEDSQGQAGQKAEFTTDKSSSDQIKQAKQRDEKDPADSSSLPKTGLSNLALSSIFLGLGLSSKKRKF